MKEATDNNRLRLNTEREIVNSSTDEQLAKTMQEEWEHGIIPENAITDSDLKRIQDRIHKEIGNPIPNRTKRLLRWIQIAASILLPICILGMAYMYHENKQYASVPMMKVTTAEGEQVSVTLPDGTQVAINASSELKYALQSFSQDERVVYFEGEGYYKVAKDKGHPFIIHSQGMVIKVLGTEFNLINRKNEETAEVALINGSVMLTSLVSGKSYTMSPNEVAIINKTTGDMDIHHPQDIQDAAAWKQKQIIYRDEPLDQVIKDLEERYGAEIKLDTNSTENFTGTLPSNNIDEALKIIAVSYHFNLKKYNSQKYIFRK